MAVKLLRIPPIREILGSVLIISTLGCMFLPEYVPFKWGSEYAVHLLFGYLGLGLFFLCICQQRLMLISMACCAAMSLFLKNAASTDFVRPDTTGAPSVRVAQVTISATNDDPTVTLQSILDTEADIVSFQEVSPDWGSVLQQSLNNFYPYASIVYRPEDFLGIAVFSKLPFSHIDTFYYNDIPNLAITIGGEEQGTEVHFISSYIYPKLGDKSRQYIAGHFETIGTYLRKLEGPVLAFGEYNQLQWSDYVQTFRHQNFLKDSRQSPFFNYPSDHIFYTQHISCTDFRTIQTPQTPHLGIVGDYQLNEESLYVQKAARKF